MLAEMTKNDKNRRHRQGNGSSESLGQSNELEQIRNLFKVILKNKAKNSYTICCFRNY